MNQTSYRKTYLGRATNGNIVIAEQAHVDDFDQLVTRTRDEEVGIEPVPVDSIDVGCMQSTDDGDRFRPRARVPNHHVAVIADRREQGLVVGIEHTVLDALRVPLELHSTFQQSLRLPATASWDGGDVVFK